MGQPCIHHWRSYLIASLTAGFLIFVLACRPERSHDPEVWTEVDGEPIVRQEVERYYRNRMATGSDAGSPEQALSFKLNLLDELINNQILVAHAARMRITVSEAEVDTKMAELQSPYSKEEFQQKLRAQGLEAGDLRQEVKRSLIINKLVNKEISARIAVTDEEIAEYFERNKAQFNIPETQYHLLQIEVTPSPDPEVRNLKNDDAKTATAAQRKILALHARVRSGEDFATVAQEYSEDPRTAAGGGDMGFLPASAMDSNPRLKQLVVALKVGETSGIIQTATGYHLIKLLGREEAGQRRLSDPQVQSAIRRSLMAAKEQLLKAAFIENLRNRAQVVNYLAERIVEAGGNPKVVP